MKFCNILLDEIGVKVCKPKKLSRLLGMFRMRESFVAYIDKMYIHEEILVIQKSDKSQKFCFFIENDTFAKQYCVNNPFLFSKGQLKRA